MGIDIQQARDFVDGHILFAKRSVEPLRWLIQFDGCLHCGGTGMHSDITSAASGRGGIILSQIWTMNSIPKLRTRTKSGMGLFEMVMSEHGPTIVGICRKYTRCIRRCRRLASKTLSWKFGEFFHDFTRIVCYEPMFFESQGSESSIIFVVAVKLYPRSLWEILMTRWSSM